MKNTHDWCLRWEVTHRKARRWDRIRHAVAVFVGAGDFYEGSGSECDSGVYDAFQPEWTERICVERNPDYVGVSPLVSDFIPRLAPSETPLAELLHPYWSPSGSIDWGWGTIASVEPDLGEPPSVGQQPPPAGVTMDEAG